METIAYHKAPPGLDGYDQLQGMTDTIASLTHAAAKLPVERELVQTVVMMAVGRELFAEMDDFGAWMLRRGRNIVGEPEGGVTH